jgi:hypothetical protein
VQLREDLATAIARAERAERLHSEAEAQIECRNEMRARVAQAERERDEAQRERYDLAQLIGKALIEIWCAPGERLAEEVDHAIVIDARRLRLRAELAERERDGYLAGYETELEVRRKAEAEVARLRGLIHAEQIAEMRYCETCELGYMVGEGSARPCPYCEVARMRAVVDAAVNWQKGEKDSKYDLYNSVVIYLRSTSELVSGKESVR